MDDRKRIYGDMKPQPVKKHSPCEKCGKNKWKTTKKGTEYVCRHCGKKRSE